MAMQTAGLQEGLMEVERLAHEIPADSVADIDLA